MFRFRLIILSGLALLAAASEGVRAGHITLQITSTPRVRDNQLQCAITATNQGDEKAAGVQAHLDFRGQRHSADSQATLGIGETYRANFTFPVVGLANGRHPLVITLDYADTNGYPFTALSSADFFIGEDNPPQIHGVIDEVELGSDARLELRIKNLDATPRELSIRLVLPKEISSPRTENQISLNGSGEQTVRFQLRNFSALEGSTYQVFALMEYDDRGKHSCLFTPGTVKIVPAGDFLTTYRLPILIGVGLLVIIFAALQFYSRKRSR